MMRPWRHVFAPGVVSALAATLGATASVLAPHLLTAQATPTPSAPAPAVCDVKLLRNATGETAYRVRGRGATWCEGTYGDEVGGVALTLEGFGRPLLVDSMRARRIDTLWVEWEAPPGSDVRLVGRSRVRGFYQLDAQLRTDDTGRGRWAWPTDVLRAQSIYPYAVPITSPAPTVWVQAIALLRGSGGAMDSVRVPVRLTFRGDTAAPASTFELRVGVTTRIERPRITLQRVGPDGEPVAATMRDGCRVPYGGLGRSNPLVVPVCLTADAPGGVYVLTASAGVSGSTVPPVHLRFWVKEAAR